MDKQRGIATLLHPARKQRAFSSLPELVFFFLWENRAWQSKIRVKSQRLFVWEVFMNDLTLFEQEEETVTTKELAESLGVDVKTIQRTSAKLFDKDVVKSVSSGGNVPVTLTAGKGLVYLAKKFNTEIDENVQADA